MPVLFVESFFPLILVRQIATIRMGLSIICFKVSQVDFHNKYVLQSLKIGYIIANSVDSDEMNITKLLFEGFSSIQRVYSSLSDEFYQVMPLGPKELKWPVQWIKC